MEVLAGIAVLFPSQDIMTFQWSVEVFSCEFVSLRLQRTCRSRRDFVVLGRTVQLK